MTVRFASRKHVWVGVIVVLGLLGTVDCAADSSRASTVSASPTTVGSVPDVTLLTASNCFGPAATSPPQLLGRYFTIRVAPNWTKTGDYQRTEILLELTAPQTYLSAPTTIQFLNDLAPVRTVYGPQATAHNIAQKQADSVVPTVSVSGIAGHVSDCSVGGEPAAAFGFSAGAYEGYFVYVVHNDLLFEVVLLGFGGVNNEAIRDSLGMIGSLKWAF
jgi:hypothetical protein